MATVMRTCNRVQLDDYQTHYARKDRQLKPASHYSSLCYGLI